MRQSLFALVISFAVAALRARGAIQRHRAGCRRPDPGATITRRRATKKSRLSPTKTATTRSISAREPGTCKSTCSSSRRPKRRSRRAPLRQCGVNKTGPRNAEGGERAVRPRRHRQRRSGCDHGPRRGIGSLPAGAAGQGAAGPAEATNAGRGQRGPQPGFQSASVRATQQNQPAPGSNLERLSRRWPTPQAARR